MSVQSAFQATPAPAQQPTEFCQLEVVDWSIKDKKLLAEQIIAACRNGLVRREGVERTRTGQL